MKTDEKQNINTCTIFYSWQSDDKRARNYIEKSLKEAVDYINRTTEGQDIINIDRDTKGKLGSPNIPRTIEEKISLCDIFIADLTVTHDSGRKKQINQNVMYECGYALSEIGDKYCILLHNQDNCEPKDLPFDIAQRRLLIYSRKSNNLKLKLLDVLPLYIESASLHKNGRADNDDNLSEWGKELLQLFKSMKKEKSLIVSRYGKICFSSGDYDKKIQQKIYRHHDPQEIRAAFTDLAEKKYLEASYTPNARAIIYNLLQKGYNYISSRE